MLNVDFIGHAMVPMAFENISIVDIRNHFTGDIQDVCQMNIFDLIEQISLWIAGVVEFPFSNGYDEHGLVLFQNQSIDIGQWTILRSTDDQDWNDALLIGPFAWRTERAIDDHGRYIDIVQITYAHDSSTLQQLIEETMWRSILLNNDLLNARDSVPELLTSIEIRLQCRGIDRFNRLSQRFDCRTQFAGGDDVTSIGFLTVILRIRTGNHVCQWAFGNTQKVQNHRISQPKLRLKLSRSSLGGKERPTEIHARDSSRSLTYLHHTLQWRDRWHVAFAQGNDSTCFIQPTTTSTASHLDVFT